jgi:cysteine sulfinate desulfinase/cysteine desulfurase-like protein
MAASHVVLAMGVERRDALSSLRLSLAPQTTEQDVRFAAGSIASAVDRLRTGKLDGGQGGDRQPLQAHLSAGGAA